MNKKVIIGITAILILIIIAVSVFFVLKEKTPAVDDNNLGTANGGETVTKNDNEETVTIEPDNFVISENYTYPGDFISFALTGPKEIWANFKLANTTKNIKLHSVGENKYIGIIGIPSDMTGPADGKLIIHDKDAKVLFESEIEIGEKNYSYKETSMAKSLVPNYSEGNLDMDEKKIAAIVENGEDIPLWKENFQLPAPGKLLTEFRQIVNADSLNYFSKGIELSTVDDNKVIAANTGKVVLAEKLPAMGNTVIIDHGAGVFTKYSRLNSFKVKVGEKVKQGEVIGTSGEVGISRVPSFEYSVIIDGIYCDPLLLNTVNPLMILNKAS